MKANKQQETVEEPTPAPVVFETRNEPKKEEVIENNNSSDKELPSFVRKLFGKR